MPHIHEKIDFTVSVYVVYKNKVLIRLHDKYNIWIAVGGHIELDEDANTAALREVKEEVGLEVVLVAPPHAQVLSNSNDDEQYSELVPPYFMNIHYVNKTHQHHDLTFIAKSNSDKVTPENPEDKWLWLTKKELNEHSKIDIKIKNYASVALEVLET